MQSLKVRKRAKACVSATHALQRELHSGRTCSHAPAVWRRLIRRLAAQAFKRAEACLVKVVTGQRQVVERHEPDAWMALRQVGDEIVQARAQARVVWRPHLALAAAHFGWIRMVKLRLSLGRHTSAWQMTTQQATGALPAHREEVTLGRVLVHIFVLRTRLPEQHRLARLRRKCIQLRVPEVHQRSSSDEDALSSLVIAKRSGQRTCLNMRGMASSNSVKLPCGRCVLR